MGCLCWTLALLEKKKRTKYTEDFQISQPVEIIFVTEKHDHAASDAIWLVKRHDPGTYFVEFYKVEPEEKVGIITVKCNPISRSETNVCVSCKYIALSENGREFVANYTSGEYKEFIGEWKLLLEKYFNA